MMLREMATTHGRSWGGYLWSIIDPVGGIVLMTMVFSLVLRNPPIGTNFMIFYATGYVPFSYFMTMSKKMSQAVDNSRALLAYPAVTVIDALVSRALVTALTGIVVAYLIFFFVLLTQETRTDPQVFAIGLSMLMASALGIGVGVVNCFLFSALPPWNTIWHILSRPLFLMSGIFYTYELMPKVVQDVLWWNPVLHLVGLMRRGIYVVYPADYVSESYVVTLSLGLLVGGLLLMWRRYRDLLELR